MACFSCYYYSSYDCIFDNGGYCKKLGMQVKSGAQCNYYITEAEIERQKRKEAEKNSGYKEGCFLTSACVEYLGKSDDCTELTKLRAFRDDYVKKIDGGQKIIDDYYAVAPVIVQKIKNSQYPDECYQYIYRVIVECVECIDKGANDEALSKYQNMVVLLKEKFKVKEITNGI